MSEYPVDTQVSDDRPQPATLPTDKATQHSEPTDRLARIAGNLLDRADSIVYAIVGVCFFLSAFFALGYCFWNFGTAMTQLASLNATEQIGRVADAIVSLISDLLLVLIIMEVMSTVIHYLKEHTTSLRPFLFIGIVSGVRGILSIGARLTVGSTTSSSDFSHEMIELGVNAGVILALGITLKLLGHLTEDKQ